jgi:hypothetical protein
LPLLAAIQQHATSVPAIDYSRPQAASASPDRHPARRKHPADRSHPTCRVALKNHGRSLCIRFCCWVA